MVSSEDRGPGVEQSPSGTLRVEGEGLSRKGTSSYEDSNFRSRVLPDGVGGTEVRGGERGVDCRRRGTPRISLVNF